MCENPARRICRHCGKNYANRPRGLCWGCYYAPGVLNLYPSTSKYVGRSVGASGKLMPAPTDAPPGSEAKLQVLIERAENNQALWHPLDAREGVSLGDLLDEPAEPQYRPAYKPHIHRQLVG
jgi:hypothetical protein